MFELLLTNRRVLTVGFLIVSSLTSSAQTLESDGWFYDFEGSSSLEPWKTNVDYINGSTDGFAGPGITGPTSLSGSNGNRNVYSAKVDPGTNYQMTAIHESKHDITKDFRQHQGFSPHKVKNLGSLSPNSGNQIMQFGMIANQSGIFKDGSTNQFYIAGTETSWTNSIVNGSPGSSSIEVDLAFYNKNGLMQTLAQDLTLEVAEVTTTDHAYSFYAMTMDIASTATIGIYDVSVNIDRWTLTYNFANQTYLDEYEENVGVYTANGLDLGFTNAELSALHPAFGYRIEDATTVSATSMNYDYPSKVPEPSSITLFLLGNSLLVWRRKR